MNVALKIMAYAAKVLAIPAMVLIFLTFGFILEMQATNYNPELGLPGILRLVLATGTAMVLFILYEMAESKKILSGEIAINRGVNYSIILVVLLAAFVDLQAFNSVTDGPAPFPWLPYFYPSIANVLIGLVAAIIFGFVISYIQNKVKK